MVYTRVFDECDVPDREIGGGKKLTDLQRGNLFPDWDDGVRRILRAIGEWEPHILSAAPQLTRWGPNDERPAGISIDSRDGPFIPWLELKREIEERLLNQVGRYVPAGCTAALKGLYGRKDWVVRIISPHGEEIGDIWFGSDPDNGWGYDGLVRVGKPLTDDIAEVWQAFQRFSDGTYRRVRSDHSPPGSLDERADHHRSLGRSNPQPALELKVFEEDVTGLNRFFYGTQKTPFLGRQHEIGALENFLADEKLFCWWIMIGEAGLGKSRLALELCLRMLDRKWRAGFLPSWCSSDDYRNWEPNQPTLIIADYVASRPTVIGDIVRMIKYRADHTNHDRVPSPVRLLLLERRIKRYYNGMAYYTDAREEEWFNNFLGSGGDHATMNSAWYGNSRSPIELGPLDPEHTWTIIRTFGKQKAREKEKGRILGRLKRIDSLSRPLYAAMLGDAIGAGRKPRQWDVNAILRDVLIREEKKFWQPAGVTKEDKDALALATMAGGIDTESAPVDVQKMIKNENFSPGRYRLMSAGSTHKILKPLEPDIIGEMFVLEHLNPDSSRRDQITKMARVLNKEKMTFFLLRTANDFPSHPNLQYLLGIP